MKAKKSNKKVNSKKKKLRLKIFKWISLIALICSAICLFLLSDLFNTKEIKVKNNSKLTKQEIISLSDIKLQENMFKFLSVNVKEKIKKNAYVQDVKIRRHLNGTVEIEIFERKPAYMLKVEEDYAYINNQGYILEINSEKLEVPEIEGFTSNNIKSGNRLEVPDLNKLNIIMQIMNSAREKEISDKINKINIEEDTAILIIMEGEQKIIHFGDNTQISNKIIKLIPVLQDNIGIKGDIFVENINKVYFRGEM